MKKLCAMIGAFFVLSGIAVVTVAVFTESHRVRGHALNARALGHSSVVLEAAVVRHPIRESASGPR